MSSLVKNPYYCVLYTEPRVSVSQGIEADGSSTWNGEETAGAGHRVWIVECDCQWNPEPRAVEAKGL